MTRHLVLLASLFGCLLLGDAMLSPSRADPSTAGDYAFAPPPGNLLRMYRVNRSTGEMGACEYGTKEGTIGTTVCYPAAEGAVAQASGVYDVIPTNLAQEGGVMRVNRATGQMSVCYLNNGTVVCTPPK